MYSKRTTRPKTMSGSACLDLHSQDLEIPIGFCNLHLKFFSCYNTFTLPYSTGSTRLLDNYRQVTRHASILCDLSYLQQNCDVTSSHLPHHEQNGSDQCIFRCPEVYNQ